METATSLSHDSHRNTTLFLDIDGVLVEQKQHVAKRMAAGGSVTILPGTLDKLLEWDRKSYKIILTTGRRECMREQTEAELASVGIFYDQLVMGVGVGKRVIINDMKPYASDVPTAEAINLPRNKGIGSLDI